MKSIKSRLGTLFLATTTLFLIGWFPSSVGSETITKSNAIVLIKFKAQPEKGAQTVSELTKLLEQVRKEPNFVSIKMHVDPNDDTNVLLYEEWEDASYADHCSICGEAEEAARIVFSTMGFWGRCISRDSVDEEG